PDIVIIRPVDLVVSIEGEIGGRHGEIGMRGAEGAIVARFPRGPAQIGDAVEHGQQTERARRAEDLIFHAARLLHPRYNPRAKDGSCATVARSGKGASGALRRNRLTRSRATSSTSALATPAPSPAISPPISSSLVDG